MKAKIINQKHLVNHLDYALKNYKDWILYCLFTQTDLLKVEHGMWVVLTKVIDKHYKNILKKNPRAAFVYQANKRRR